MDLWLPGYEHQPVHGAGLSVGPGKPKVGSHTTETGPGSLQTLINHWHNHWGSGLPHFAHEGRRIVQLLPLNVGAYTAQNRPGGADINRSGPMIQIETVARAADGWDEDTYETFGRWLADLKTAGHDFDIGQHPRFYGANEGIVLARESSPIRFTAQQFDAFNGWLGHQHFPENDHWDPGGIDAIRIERIARARLAQTTNPGGDEPLTPEDRKFIADEQEKTRVYLAGKHEETRQWLRDQIDKATVNEGEKTRVWSTGQHETTRTWLADRIAEDS
jgi:hypothetical protein